MTVPTGAGARRNFVGVALGGRPPLSACHFGDIRKEGDGHGVPPLLLLSDARRFARIQRGRFLHRNSGFAIILSTGGNRFEVLGDAAEDFIN